MPRTRLRILATAVLLAVTAALTGCSSSDDTAPAAARADLPDGSPTLERIVKAGELVVGTPDDMPGFNLLDPITGKYTGFEADLAAELAEHILGAPKVKHVAITTDTREALIVNNTVDAVLSTYQITAARLERINFAGPDLLLGTGIVARKDFEMATVTALPQLAKVRVITTAGAAADILKAEVPGAELVVFDSAVACVRALEDGRGDVFVNNEATAIAVLAEHKNLKIVPNTLPDASFGIGVSKSDPVFTKFVNDFLTAAIADGTWKKLWEKNVTPITGEPAPKPPVVGDLGLE
ncbi:transporter substrate-binding domain-containing protein [Cryptosporangium aurantiacum]|uniref:Glutamate transport system substrate-binding protein n=1 Tax=Cryptosporangium aurantiacum TaxID=134849 RepID=A0A1M7RJT2_9ACTN|nr:transporter substrate-binding domain-containing protein [Cryptosporangium aurantiacum]SHN46328.1 glutamate transport system substrate-binding protein [Cryptosporangium aurantiacum]